MLPTWSIHLCEEPIAVGLHHLAHRQHLCGASLIDDVMQLSKPTLVEVLDLQGPNYCRIRDSEEMSGSSI